MDIENPTECHEETAVEETDISAPEYCDPCTFSDTSNIASAYCTDCEERLCENCVISHAKRKATSTHNPVAIQQRKTDHTHVCTPCIDDGKDDLAVTYCEECEEFLCDRCTKSHRSRKATKLHSPIAVKHLNEKELATALKDCKLSEDVQLIRGNAETYAHATQSDEKIPGKPRPTDILSDSITLSWDPPSTFGDEDYYQVSYKEVDHEKKWRFLPEEYTSSTVVLRDLKSSTAFLFRVRVVYEDGEGPFSEESDKIQTTDSPASRFVMFSLEKEKGGPSPTKYVLPMTENKTARNEQAKTKKFEVDRLVTTKIYDERGATQHYNNTSRTIMLVGATGTGKSTLVDGIVNYVLGVNWDDPFRFTVIDLEQDEKDRSANQALSQTEWITCYTLNPEKGSRLKYQLTIIDTPGFGDTRGLKRDQEIVEQIRQLFSEKQPKGVTYIDAVCFLVKAPDARLTAVQSYIFQSVMSLFGKDIEENICSLITFADGLDPPVLAALNQSGLPFGQTFTFNNSGLFAKNASINASTLSPMFWEMGIKSFRAFFDHLEQIETKSLQLTKDVLDERSRLEATVKNLQPQLDAGLLKVNSLKQEIKVIEENKSLIKANADFEYEVEETRQKKKALPRGRHVTNCSNCHFTCHDNCDHANDSEKARCSAMGSNGYCKICPGKCHWTTHANTAYIFEYITVKEKRTYAEMQKRYQEATEELLSQEQVVERLGKDLGELVDVIEEMMNIIKDCNERLEEIALRPNPLSMTEHIDLMIEAEKLERKEGFLQRINILNDFRKKALISKDYETLREEAYCTLRSVGMKKKVDVLSVMTRMKLWLRKRK